jgi:hypothetical protein
LHKFGLDCRSCSEGQKIERGCEADSPVPGIWKLDDWEFQRCPRKIISGVSLEYLTAYFFFGKGFLPNAGGWLDQPAKFVQAMIVVEREVARVREEKENADKPRA